MFVYDSATKIHIYINKQRKIEKIYIFLANFSPYIHMSIKGQQFYF